MRELSNQELSLVSEGKINLKGLMDGIKKAFVKADPVTKSVAKDGATGTGSYIVANTIAGNDMTIEGVTGATVAGMFVGRFNNGPVTAIMGAGVGGATEKVVKDVNSVLKNNDNGSGNHNWERDNFGGR